MKNIKEKLLSLTVEIDQAGFVREASELDLIINNTDDEADADSETEDSEPKEAPLSDPGEIELVRLILTFLTDLVKTRGFTDDEITEQLNEILKSIEESSEPISDLEESPEEDSDDSDDDEDASTST